MSCVMLDLNDIPFVLVEERRSYLWLAWIFGVKCVCAKWIVQFWLFVFFATIRKFSSHQCHQESDLFIEYPQIHYIFRYIVR